MREASQKPYVLTNNMPVYKINSIHSSTYVGGNKIATKHLVNTQERTCLSGVLELSESCTIHWIPLQILFTNKWHTI